MIEVRVRLRTLAVVGTIAVAMLVAGTAIGATLQKNGGPVTAVRTATADDLVRVPVSTSYAWTNVPGMTLTTSVPAGERGLFVITFSAMGQCQGATAFCQVRVLVDGTPVPPGDVVFDSTDDGPGGSVNSYETNSMQFIAGYKQAGSHTVTVQFAVSPAGQANFELHDRTLTVLRAKVP